MGASLQLLFLVLDVTFSSQGLINWRIPFLVYLVGVYMTLTFNFSVGVGCMVGTILHTSFEIP